MFVYGEHNPANIPLYCTHIPRYTCKGEHTVADCLIQPVIVSCLQQEVNIDTESSAMEASIPTVLLPLTAFKSQKCEQTSCVMSVITHRDNDHFILNLHSLHNAYLIPRIFPPDSLQAQPFVLD